MKSLWISLVLFVVFSSVNAQHNFPQQDHVAMKTILRNSSTFLEFAQRDIQITRALFLEEKTQERYTHSASNKIWIQGKDLENNLVTLEIMQGYSSTMCQPPSEYYSDRVIDHSKQKFVIPDTAKSLSKKFVQLVQILVSHREKIQSFFVNFNDTQDIIPVKVDSLPYLHIENFTYDANSYHVNAHWKPMGKEYQNIDLRITKQQEKKYKVHITSGAIKSNS